jgi:hypothetical protein
MALQELLVKVLQEERTTVAAHSLVVVAVVREQ